MRGGGGPSASHSDRAAAKAGEPLLTLRNSVQSEFRIDDVGGAHLLQAYTAADRADALAARLHEDGETILTKMGLEVHLKDIHEKAVAMVAYAAGEEPRPRGRRDRD